MKKTLLVLSCGLLAFQQAKSCNVDGTPNVCKDLGTSHCVATCGSKDCTYSGITITYYTGVFAGGKVYKAVAYDDGNPCDGQDSTKPLYAGVMGYTVTVANCVASYTPVFVSFSDCDGTQPDGNACSCNFAIAKQFHKL